jgi:predicted DNA-binding transcriptional regulator YafY
MSHFQVGHHGASGKITGRKVGLAASISTYRHIDISTYRHIEIIAYWERRLTTNHLMNAFGIWRQQASKDINAYLKDFATDNLIYDPRLKGYKPTANFLPLFTIGVADEYFQLLSIRDHLNSTPILLGGAHPAISERISPPLRDLRPEVLAPVIQAAREGKRLEICYSSLSNPAPEYRVIQPHTVVFNGLRWHVRAFCERKMVYSDFVLSRISDRPELTLVGDNTAEKDIAWQTMVTLELCPDPRPNDN